MSRAVRQLAALNRVNAHLAFRGPLAVRTRMGDMVVGLSFRVGEPREVASRFREKVESRARQ